jgi:hypothetical protein
MTTSLTPIKGDGFLLYECQQGTPEWLRCRAGVITASEFKKARHKINGLTAQQSAYVSALRRGASAADAMALAGYKRPPSFDSLDRALAGERIGEFSATALNYAFQKAVERICQEPLDDGPVTWQMRHGQKQEPHARAAHEDVLERRGGALADMMVLPAGFMTTEDGVFGCSVDGLIGAVGGAEYKCLSSAASMRPVLMDDDISAFMDQIQGCMWISGRDWWHFGLYVPKLKAANLQFYMIEVERDDNYIDELEADLLEFVGVVNRYEAKLRTMGAKLVEEAAAEIRASIERESSEQMLELAEAF